MFAGVYGYQEENSSGGINLKITKEIIVTMEARSKLIRALISK